MPEKAAFSLGMREGCVRKKVEIIQAIRAILPLSEGDRRRRKSNNEMVLKEMEAGI